MDLCAAATTAILSGMVRAFSTLGCPDIDVRTAMAIAERYNIEGLELRALGETVNLPAYFTSEYGTPESFAAAVRGRAVRIIALATSLHLADSRTSDREQFLMFVPWAEAAGIRWLRVFDGAAKLSDRSALAATIDAIEWWRDVRASGGFKVDIMIETHDRLFTAAKINRLVAAAPNTAILWDTHHTWKQGGEDPVATWRAIRESVVHIHVKDSVAVPAATHPYKYVLPGAGEFPMPSLRQALEADKFEGGISLEWEKLWHRDLPSVDEALRVAAERARW